ncbi:MAG: AMP-binding protein [Proteobacteria bacterium]|nr:AMP-binding protein [Pseudomonadota bacterium]
MNAAEILIAAGADERIALECGERRLSYAELRDAVRRATGAWRHLGLLEDERVLIFAPDGIAWVIAYLGAIAAGGVAVGLNSRLFEKELGVILSESGARFICCEAGSLPLLNALCAKLEHPPRILEMDGEASEWQRLLASAPALEAVPRRPEDMAFWIYTSGTTGRPKAVIHAQRMVDGCMAVAQELLGLSVNDRLYASSKLFFAYSLGNSLLAGLRLGATVVLDGEWPTAERVAAICEQHHPTVLFSVPTLYHKIVQAGLAQRLKVAGVRHLVSAGESLPMSVRRALEDATGISPLSGYGTSETLALMLYSRDDNGILRPTPLTEVRNCEAISESDKGMPRRLCFSHPAVALGYWQRPEAQTDFHDGWFSPGDMFVPCERDTPAWEYSGRTDDMLKISGQWVSTIAVDQALLAACGDSVQELGSVALKNAEGLTEIAVFVVPAAGRAADAQARLAAGIAALPGFKRPRRIRLMESLPRTATGKLQRNKLAGMLQE